MRLSKQILVVLVPAFVKADHDPAMRTFSGLGEKQCEVDKVTMQWFNDKDCVDPNTKLSDIYGCVSKEWYQVFSGSCETLERSQTGIVRLNDDEFSPPKYYDQRYNKVVTIECDENVMRKRIFDGPTTEPWRQLTIHDYKWNTCHTAGKFSYIMQTTQQFTTPTPP